MRKIVVFLCSLAISILDGPSQCKFEFLEVLNSFYKESDFKKWFDSTKQVREESIQAFSAISSSIDMDWYGSFSTLTELSSG